MDKTQRLVFLNSFGVFSVPSNRTGGHLVTYKEVAILQSSFGSLHVSVLLFQVKGPIFHSRQKILLVEIRCGRVGLLFERGAQSSCLFEVIPVGRRFGHGRYLLVSIQLLQQYVDTAAASGLVGGEIAWLYSSNTTTTTTGQSRSVGHCVAVVDMTGDEVFGLFRSLAVLQRPKGCTARRTRRLDAPCSFVHRYRFGTRSIKFAKGWQRLESRQYSCRRCRPQHVFQQGKIILLSVVLFAGFC
jgi:hypothetical protein